MASAWDAGAGNTPAVEVGQAATNAENSATQAATSATNSANSATAAANSASAASTSATNASTSATNAASSASSAQSAQTDINTKTHAPIVQTWNIATAGQTQITAITAYVQNTNALSVEVNGIDQTGAYTEDSTTSITFSEGLHAGDKVVIRQVNTVPTGTLPATGVTYKQRNVDARLSDIISVKDYGATGDGVTDDTTAIQQTLAVSSVFNLVPATYKISAVIPLAKSGVSGKSSKLLGSGVSFKATSGNDFYDYSIDNITLDGTNAGTTIGVDIAYAHKGNFRNVRLQNYTNPASLSNAFTNNWYGCSMQSNTNGITVSANSNSCNFSGCTFANNTNFGARVVGSYANSFWGCDFEYNYVGVYLTNTIAAGAAEHRNTNLIGCYFEGNSNDNVHIGDDTGVTDVTRNATIAFCYGINGTNQATAVRVQKSSGAKLLYNDFGGTYTAAKYFLRADSRNTTIIPFNTADIVMETGATVSLQTIQSGTVQMGTDAGGNGYVDVTFKVPYDSLPYIDIRQYDTTDPGTSLASLRLNNVTTSGFRVRAVGNTASATLNVMWRAGN